MAFVPTLPLEVLEMIASESPLSWRSMLSIPAFGRYSLSKQSQSVALNSFSEVITHKGWEFHLFAGKLHGVNDEPAIVYKSEKGRKTITKMWYRHGVLYRKGSPYQEERMSLCDGDVGPAVLEIQKFSYLGGLLHSHDDHPSIVIEYREEDGSLSDAGVELMWHRRGSLHRGNDLPARVLFSDHPEEPILSLSWYFYGKQHRSQAPSEIAFFNSEMIKAEWIRYGLACRRNGPTFICFTGA